MIRESVPKTLVAGDTWRWTRDFSDYPADTWTVTYYFENASKQFNAAASTSGSSHAVSIAAATTAGYPSGRYRWFARATDGTIVETIEGEEGWIEVLPDPAASGTRDHRNWARRALDAVQATIEGRATTDQQAMAIGGRSIARMPYEDLRKLQQDLEARVKTEEGRNTNGKGRMLKARFSRA